MPTHTNDKIEKTGTNQLDLQMDSGIGTFQLQDNRQETMVAKTIQRMADRQFASPENEIVQRYPDPISDEDAMGFRNLHDTELGEKKDKEITAKELAELKSGVYSLTDFSPEDMNANCIGWAKGEDVFEDPGNIYLWKQEYDEVAASAADAKIILWGNKNKSTDTNKWSVLHASVKLTHAEIAARSKTFGGFSKISTNALSEAGIDNPCWTSAAGAGFGVIVHPKNWLEGGDFGTALIGLK